MAAGRGKRLGTLTTERPKPMLPVRGRPVLEHIVRGLLSAGLGEILLVVGYRGDAIVEHFGDGGALGARIAYVWQSAATGTGAALACGREFAAGEPVLAAYGDILTDPAHYAALLASYAAAPCGAVIGVNYMEDPSAGAAVFREGDRVTRVVEKPPPGTARSHWNVAGVSVFGPAVWPILDALTLSPRGEYELTAAIERLIGTGAGVRAVELAGFWSDIGTPAALAEAERLFHELAAGARRPEDGPDEAPEASARAARANT